VVPVFYALGDTRTPVVVSALDLLAFIALAVTLRGPMGHVGISIAVAGSSFVQMALLFIAMRRKLGFAFGADVLASASRTLLASVIGGVGAWGLARAVTRTDAGQGGLSRALPGALSVALFGVLFVLVAWGARSAELESLVQSVKRRLARR
jgi:putative peptidoglycan lipid II flippase